MFTYFSIVLRASGRSLTKGQLLCFGHQTKIFHSDILYLIFLVLFKSGAFYDIGGRRSRLMVSRCVLPPFESTLPRISWSVFSPVHHIHSTKSYKINGLTLISFLQDRGLTSVEPSHLYDSMFFQGV